MADLKRVYAAIDEDTALQELDRFDEIWGGKYPKIADNWRDKWVHPHISSILKQYVHLSTQLIR